MFFLILQFPNHLSPQLMEKSKIEKNQEKVLEIDLKIKLENLFKEHSPNQD